MRHLNNVPDEMLQKITAQRRGRGTAGLRHNARALLNDHELQQHVLPHPGGENRGDAARECGELIGGHAEDDLQFLIRDARVSDLPRHAAAGRGARRLRGRALSHSAHDGLQ